MAFNPWEVSGAVDYDKLVKQFGIKPLKKLPAIFEKNILFSRKKIFAHRDFEKIAQAIEQKKPFCVMTGLMPTGKFHIGHMILAQQFIFYQSLGAKIYIAIADIEAYHARSQSLETSRKIAIEEYVKNYIALGLKKENLVLYFQSERSDNAFVSNSYYRLQNLLARHATFNEFQAVYGEISPGKMISALLQAADMLHPSLDEFEGAIPILIPVGIDQDPHIRLARDIAKRIKEKKVGQLSSTYHLFVPGLDGGKMSSSVESSYIGLTDDPVTIKKKVNKYAFSGGRATLEEHRKLGGNPDIDVSYQWLTFFEQDDALLDQIAKKYRSGELLSGELKAIIIEKLQAIIGDVQKKRAKITQKDIEQYFS
ncbi:MAG: tryptophan--tRNA ligase [Candidatus Woesearchaeota archaeon]